MCVFIHIHIYIYTTIQTIAMHMNIITTSRHGGSASSRLVAVVVVLE